MLFNTFMVNYYIQVFFSRKKSCIPCKLLW